MEKIPKDLVEASLAIEDKDFYRHQGLSIKGIAQALWHNLRNGINGLRVVQQLPNNWLKMFSCPEKRPEKERLKRRH